MRYLIRIVQRDGLRDGFLSSIKAVAKSVCVDARNPKWTSYGALELDIFAPSKADMDTFLAAVEPLGRMEFWRDLNVAPQNRTEEELFSEARRYFNSERYWECHEVLEDAWRLKGGEEKKYVQGIILVCAAFVHHQKGEDEAALSVLRRALKQLDFGAQRYHGIGVNSLRRRAEGIASSGRFEDFRI
ncbi:MAG: DUF309 domain-containing protein [Nitrososphaerales archaeon]|jgi:hypothetical protein